MTQMEEVEVPRSLNHVEKANVMYQHNNNNVKGSQDMTQIEAVEVPRSLSHVGKRDSE